MVLKLKRLKLAVKIRSSVSVFHLTPKFRTRFSVRFPFENIASHQKDNSEMVQIFGIV